MQAYVDGDAEAFERLFESLALLLALLPPAHLFVMRGLGLREHFGAAGARRLFGGEQRRSGAADLAEERPERLSPLAK